MSVDKRMYGVGIMETIEPWQRYMIDMREWYRQKPKYPIAGIIEHKPERRERIRTAWEVFRGRAVAIRIDAS